MDYTTLQQKIAEIDKQRSQLREQHITEDNNLRKKQEDLYTEDNKLHIGDTVRITSVKVHERTKNQDLRLLGVKGTIISLCPLLMKFNGFSIQGTIPVHLNEITKVYDENNKV